MTIWAITSVLLWIVVLAAGWLLTLLGLPGNWLIVLGAAAYHLWGPMDGRLEMSLSTLIALAVLATIGEILEFALGAVTARRAGGSRRAAVGALGGGIAGGVVGMFVGIPIPIVGPVIAAVLFAAVGAMAGAFLAQGSMREAEDARKAWHIGKAAFWGRLSGTLAKLVVGTVMVVVGLAALVAK